RYGDRLGGGDGEPVRLLVLEAQPAGALVPDGDRLRPPSRDAVLSRDEGGGLTVPALLTTPPVEDREPLVPLPAGCRLHPVVGRAVAGLCQPGAGGLEAFPLLGDLAAGGGVA